MYIYKYIYIYSYELNEGAWYATQSLILFKQSSGIHFIYLFSKKNNKKTKQKQNKKKMK